MSTNRALALVVALVLAVGGWGRSVPALAKVGPPQVGCRSCLLLDVTGDRVLFARAADTRLPNASTTKMMTALLVAEASDPNELVRVSEEAAAVGGGGLDLAAGDVYSVEDLLYALLLDSSNEAASALAHHVAGDTAAFVRRMNRRARRLGTTSTQFVNPHGLDAAGHGSTATDLAKIAIELLENPMLATIVATPRQTISTPGGTAVVENRNVLLESYRGAIGVKTGRTLGAGDVLVAAARRGPRFLIAVAMRSIDAAADARILLDHGFDRLARTAARQRARDRRAASREGVVLATNEQVGALVFDPAGATGVVAGEDVMAPLPSEDPVAVRFTPANELLLPLEEGERIGTVEVMSGRELIATVPALADDAVDVEDASWGTKALSSLLRTAAVVVDGIAA